MPTKSIAQEKSFQFSLKVIELFQKLQRDKEFVISKQLNRCGTSIGANIEEALASQSRKDFHAKMTIASKEAREARYWLRLLQESQLAKMDFSSYLQMVDELVRILTAITKTAGQKIHDDL